MATFVPPKRATAFTFYVSLVQQASPKLFQVNPTLAAGDVKVSIDGGAEANLATLPVVTPAGSRRVKVDLSVGEMTGDNIQVTFSDASGAEWCDLTVNIQTTARQVDDLAYPATSGRSLAVEADGMIFADIREWLGTAPLALSSQRVQALAGAMAAGVIDAAAIATDAIDNDAIAANAVTEIQAGLATAAALAIVAGYIDTEIADIQARLPAALVSGRIDASVGAMAAGVITAAAIATDAIDNDAIAANAVTEIQAGLATAAALATVQADTDNIQTRLPAALVSGRMDSDVGAMQAGVVTPAAVATDAIDGDAIAASAVSEIQAGLATSAALATVQADTDNIQTRLPAALVSGRMDSDVGAMQAGVVTAAAVATDAIDADALAANAVTEIQSGLATASALATAQGEITAIKAKTDNLPSGIKKNTALAKFSFLMVDSTDHVTPKTGLTGFTAQRSLDGAAFAACANAVTELASGIYLIDLATSDLNGDVVTFRFVASGGDDRLLTVVTEP